MAETHLKDLPKSGKSGEWNFSVSGKGYITRELYVEVLKDLDKFLAEKNIPRPVILIIDGANPHISLEAAAFCKEKGIQPWLLKPNMTHILQPLDLTFFSSLKKQLKTLVWDWQCTPSNAGQSLNKYSIVALLRVATELCLEKPDLILNGFRRAGIFPWDPLAPDTSKLLPGTIFQTTQIDSIPPPATVMETTPSAAASQPLLDMEYDTVQPPLDMTDTEHDIQCQSNESPPPSNPFTKEAITPTQYYPRPVLDTDVEMEDFEQLQSHLTQFSPPLESIPLSPVKQPDNVSLDVLPTQFSPQLVSILASSVIQPDNVSSDVSPPSTSANDAFYWKGQTMKCPNCDKIVFKKFLNLHTESCKAPSADTAKTPVSKHQTTLETVPQFSFDDRLTQLNKFEVLLLTQAQVAEFNKLFLAKKFDISEALFHSWLSLKLASIPTESEALSRVLSAHTAANVPKNKQRRQTNLPTGGARYDPTSPEWVSLLQDQENNKTAKPNKKTVTTAGPNKKSANTAKSNKKTTSTSKKDMPKKNVNRKLRV